MKKPVIFIIFLASALIFFIPLSSINADPDNLVFNGDFSQGADGLEGWTTTSSVVDEELLLFSGGGEVYASTTSAIDLTDPINNAIWNDPRATLRFDICADSPSGGSPSGGFDLHLNLYDGAEYYYLWIWDINPFSIHPGFTTYSINIKDWLKRDLPPKNMSDFIEVYRVYLKSRLVNVYIDNIFIGLGDPPSESDEEENSDSVQEESVWVRNHPMTCYQVWINEDNAFEFVFWWEYLNNNHVQIFDASGNLAWEIDFKKGNPHFVAELPDGMYTVKTFHEAGHILQEFVIGKP